MTQSKILELLLHLDLTINEIHQRLPDMSLNTLRTYISRMCRNNQISYIGRRGREKVYSAKVDDEEIRKLRIELQKAQQELRRCLYEISIRQGLSNLGPFNPSKFTEFLQDEVQFLPFLEQFYKNVIREKFGVESYFLLNPKQKLSVELDLFEDFCDAFGKILHEILMIFGPLKINLKKPSIFGDIGATWCTALVCLFGIHWIGYEKSAEKQGELQQDIINYIYPIARMMNIPDYQKLIEIRGEYKKNTYQKFDYSHLKLTLHHLGERINPLGREVADPIQAREISYNLFDHTNKILIIGDRIKNQYSQESFQIKDWDRIEREPGFFTPQDFQILIAELKDRGASLIFVEEGYKELYDTLITKELDTSLGFNHDHYIWFKFERNGKPGTKDQSSH